MADLATNRKAWHDYHVLETLEAGIALTGTEVKSCRARNLSLGEAYGRVEGGELFLYNMHISPYEEGNRENHDPRRRRKLLVHRVEIRKLAAASREKGLTLVPLSAYLKRGRVKIAVGICRGKTKGDKRQALKEKQADREIRQALRRRR
jgi:SsrA-binding protein